MTKKRFVLLACLVVALVAVAACGSTKSKLGKVRVGTEAAYPPFELKDDKGTITGFDIDLMTAVAKEAGFEVEFVDTPFDGIFVAVQSGQFDAVISATTITEERAQIVNFSDPYFDAGLAIVVMKDSPVQKPEDLNGKKIGVQLGTTGDMEATKRYGEANVSRYDDVLLAFQALLAGDIDAIVNDLPVTQGYMNSNPNAGLRLVEGMLTSEKYGIAVSKNKPELLTAINKALATLKSNGTYDEIFKKWFSTTK